MDGWMAGWFQSGQEAQGRRPRTSSRTSQKVEMLLWLHKLPTGGSCPFSHRKCWWFPSHTYLEGHSGSHKHTPGFYGDNTNMTRPSLMHQKTHFNMKRSGGGVDGESNRHLRERCSSSSSNEPDWFQPPPLLLLEPPAQSSDRHQPGPG